MPNATDERTIRRYLIGNRLQTLDATIRALIEPRHAQRFFHNVVGLPSSPRGMAFRRLGPIRAPLVQAVLGPTWMLERRNWEDLARVTALLVKRCSPQSGCCVHPTLCGDRHSANAGWQTLLDQVHVAEDEFTAVLPRRQDIRYERDASGRNHIVGIDWAQPEAPTVVSSLGDCAGCGLPLYTNSQRWWDSLPMHSGCPVPIDRCRDCRQPIRIDQQYDRQGGSCVHQVCGEPRPASPPRICTVCAVAIQPTDRQERFRGTAWMHRDCAIRERVCTVCQRSILRSEVSVQRLDRIIHARCARQYLDESTALCLRCARNLNEQDASIWDGRGLRLHAICPMTT